MAIGSPRRNDHDSLIAANRRSVHSVAVSKTTANGIRIEYESYGRDGDPAILLIMGLGAQLTLWPLPLVEALVDRGYRVIRFDNRDVGLSTKFDDARTPNPYALVVARMLRFNPRVPYTLGDMAADAAGLLDALGIPGAHIVGASMGGMIAQHFALAYPARTLSLTSIMSTTGNPALPRASKDAMRVLTKRPRTEDIDTLVAHGIVMAKTIAGPGYPIDDALLAERVRESIARMSYTPGFTRQLAAIIADGDRRERLKAITAPTVVIHGTTDPLVPVEAGRDTAAHIRGARLVELPDMGHSLPIELIPAVVDAIVGVAEQRLAA